MNIGGFVDAGVIAAVSGVVGSIITGVPALLILRAQTRKIQAEACKIEAETEDLTSTRLIRQLDRLESLNESQRREIDQLRLEVIEYGAREIAHMTENAALRLRVKELEDMPNRAILGQVLGTVYPVDIPHTPSEYDEPAASDN